MLLEGIEEGNFTLTEDLGNLRNEEYLTTHNLWVNWLSSLHELLSLHLFHLLIVLVLEFVEGWLILLLILVFYLPHFIAHIVQSFLKVNHLNEVVLQIRLC